MIDIGPFVGPLVRGALLASVALLWVVLLVRIMGLRSLSKMTSVDFIMTIAMGSLVGSGSQSEKWSTFVQTMAAMAALFAVQFAIAYLRRRSDRVSQAVQNEPLLLMRDGRIIESALAESRVTRSDLLAKLREANVGDLATVRAAVLETTGDVSVLHGGDLDETILSSVRTA